MDRFQTKSRYADVCQSRRPEREEKAHFRSSESQRRADLQDVTVRSDVQQAGVLFLQETHRDLMNKQGEEQRLSMKSHVTFDMA